MAHQREIEARKKFDEWKEKERSKLYGEIDKLKQLFWDEFKTVANQNSTLEEVPNTNGFSKLCCCKPVYLFLKLILHVVYVCVRIGLPMHTYIETRDGHKMSPNIFLYLLF